MLEALRGNDVFPFEDCLLVIPRREPRLFLLNPTARTIWEGLAQGVPPDDVTARLAARFDVPEDRVRADVDTILAEWRAHRLLAPPSSSTIAAAESEATARPALPPGSFHGEHVYSLCGRPIRLRLEAAEMELAIHPPLAHSVVLSGQAADGIDVLRDGAGYLVACNRSDIERAATLEEALGQVFGRILELSYPDAEWLAAMHAAAVGDQRGVVVMPGDSGSGKSTLTAALVDAGLSYFSDDIVPLDATRRIRPVPLGISVKEGSWPVLATRYPELGTLPIFEGRRRRYLPIDPARIGPAGLPATSIVFPSYSANRPTILRPLTPLETLERLTRTRSWMALDGRRFAGIVRWIEETPGYDLGHGSLEDAVLAITRLLRGRSLELQP